jgi:hypothetical protein
MSAKADMFGGDVAVLMQILEENIRHYYQLQQMIQQGQNADSYLRLINSGIDNSRSILQTLPIKDERVLAELRDFSFALGKIQGLYGTVPHSPEQDVQTLHDQTVAESLEMTNKSKDYSDAQERNSDDLAADARMASPKGAARMQAETSAQILRSLVQLLRINTQILKIQSEQLAMNNKGSKESVANYQKISRDLGGGFSNFKPEMNLERF